MKSQVAEEVDAVAAVTLVAAQLFKESPVKASKSYRITWK
jgi:hypothetical protein